MSDIEEIKRILPIEEVVGSYIKLEKAGSNFKARCPFHNEKTPSFYVTPGKGFYKCFGCGESGDIFSFVEKYEGISFNEALKKLADKAGYQLSNFSSQEDKKKKEKRERYYKILEEITLFWQRNLLQNVEVKEYLKKRGVDEEMAKKFRLGFAVDSWDQNLNFLLSKGYQESDIEKVGLIKKKENGRGYYDRFRNRIIFPIFDLDNRVIAFSGRDFSGSDNVAKYLNSPETELFNKSKILYGMNFARDEVRRRKYFILAEGQMDLIMSHKIGFKNTVVTSGTSLTDEHLKIMARFSKNIIFAFDADNAGVNAAYKGIKKALNNDFDVKIIEMEKGKDPADTILESAEKWKHLVANARNFIDFFIEKILFQDKSDKEKIIEMEEKILPFILEVSDPILRGKYIGKIAKGFEIKEDFILEALNQVKEQKKEENKESLVQEIKDTDIDISPKSGIIDFTRKKILRELSGVYFWQKKLNEKDRWLEPENVLEVIKKYSDKKTFEKILNLKNDFINLLILEVQVKFENSTKENFQFIFESYKKRLKNIFLDEEIAFLTKKMNFSTEEEKREILLKIQNLIKEKN